MKKSFVLLPAALALGSALAAPPSPDTVRQRFAIDPALAGKNAALVAKDMAGIGKKGDVALYRIPALSAVKRLPDAYPEDGKIFAPVTWVAAQKEFECASFLLYSRKDFTGVEIKATDLVSGKNSIPGGEIDFRIVKPWYQSGGGWHGYFADSTGRTLVPELLLKDENLIYTDDETKDYYVRYENEDGKRRYAWMSARFETVDYSFDNQANQGLIKDSEKFMPFVLNKDEFKQFFATVRVPANQPEGIYQGTISFVEGGKTIASAQMRLRVLPFELPLPKTSYNPDKGFYLSLYGTGTRNPKILKNLADHNCLTPMGFPAINPISPASFDEDIALAREYGFLTRPLLFGAEGVGIAVWSDPMSDADAHKLEGLRNTIAKTRDLSLEKLGHTDFYSYGVDEGGPRVIRAERPAWRIAHEAGGMVGVTSYTWRELLFALDLLIVPGMPVPKRAEELSLFHKSNPDALVGWYANPHCGPENPDYFRRIHGLSAWQAGYDVSSNYCWWRNNWNDMAVPYEPNLRALVSVYGAYDGVLDTLAWEGIREGIDDVRYATLAKELAIKAASSKDGNVKLGGRRVLSFLAYWDGFRQDPDAFRMECIKHILSLRALLDGASANN